MRVYTCGPFPNDLFTSFSYAFSVEPWKRPSTTDPTKLKSKILFFFFFEKMWHGFSSSQSVSPCGVHLSEKFSVNVERATQPKMAAGSWQGWESWSANSSLWDEGKWDKKWLSKISRERKEVKAHRLSILEGGVNRSTKNPRSKKTKKR